MLFRRSTIIRRFFRHIINNLSTFILSLILALIVWVVAASEENPIKTDVFGSRIPIQPRNLPAGMEIYGDWTQQVQVRIRAPQSSWEVLTPEKFEAWVDLEGLPPGDNEVPVQVTCSDRMVRILEVRPDTVNIPLDIRREVTMTVQVNLVGSPALGYTNGSPIVEPREVVVRGPASLVDQVAQVSAYLDLRGARQDVERTINLQARNAQGQTLFDRALILEPKIVQVRVPIKQLHGFKDVAVRVIMQGQVASGYRVSNVSVEPSIVTIVGSPAIVDQVPGYVETMPLDLTGAQADIIETVPLTLPRGVSVLGEQGVQVHIEVTPIQGGLTVQRRLTIQGLREGLKARASPEVVDVILSGPLPRLEVLKPSEVVVILDLLNMRAGVYKVEAKDLKVVVPEGITVENILPGIIEVEILPVRKIPGIQ